MKKFAGGFTLIELITVIIILSILAATGTGFIVESTKSYQSTQTRSRLVNTGRQAVERMSRQLRVSLPYSVRITNSNTCLEFMPIASGGNYSGVNGLNNGFVPDALNGAAATSAVNVSPHVIAFGNAQFVSIGAMAATELYGTNPVSRATLASRTVNTLTLSVARIWQRNSVNQRFYLLDFPQAFCVVNNELRFYAEQDASSDSVDLNSSYSVMADSVTAAAPFALTAGSENRNTIVQFNITFAVKAESVAFNHSVMIRNVP